MDEMKIGEVHEEFRVLKQNFDQFKLNNGNKCDIMTSLKGLTCLFRGEKARNELSGDYLKLIGQYICAITSSSARHSLDVYVELLRLLRNVVANSRKNQLLVTSLCPSIVSDTLKQTGILVEEVENSFDGREEKMVALRCCVQFYGNLVADNTENKLHVWQLFGAQRFLECIRVSDSQLTKFACMFLYNCLVGCPSHVDELMSTPHLTALLVSAAEDEVEWALYAVETLASSPRFMSECYEGLRPDFRLKVLDIFLEMLSRDEPDKMNRENLSDLVRRFEADSDAIFKARENSRLNLDAAEMCKTLEVLSAATAAESTLTMVRGSSGLLACCCGLLLGIRSATEGSRRADVKPVFGLERNVVRTIANLCWRHKENQDKVREWGCVPALLGRCRFDDSNPLVEQWAILAVRNLCEGNPENAALIASLDRKGPVGPRAPPSGPRAPREDRDVEDLFS